MKPLILENPMIAGNKRRLEKILNAKITIKGEEIIIDGKAEDEYVAEKVIDALNFGFPFSVAVMIKKNDFLFEILNIKDYTKRKDYESVRARIIGEKGRVLKTLCNLTNCFFELKDNEVGIIGSPECMQNAQNAVISIAHGSKHANVYAFLEKHHPAPVLDLGLKKSEKK